TIRRSSSAFCCRISGSRIRSSVSSTRRLRRSTKRIVCPRRIRPITGYLIEANLAGKKYSMAADLARVARSQRPDDLRLARLEAQALRQTGKPDQGIAVLQD